MLDFTSSLYLGLRHASTSLRPWAQLTSGVPAALATPLLAKTLGRDLAELVGAERATLSRSTLHAFWDLFLILGEKNTTIYFDANTYPIAQWGIERAACRGIPVRRFKHHRPEDLWRQLRQDLRRGRHPLVVTDGFCTGCGRLAPIRAYLAMMRRFGGTVVLDDTQALGVLGHSPTVAMLYGSGGGGSLRANGLAGAPVVLVNSLAKGFGVPMAMIAGSASQVARFESQSMTQVHSSPPSFADLHAAESALESNRTSGEAMRARLMLLIRRFRARLGTAGVPLGPSLFPVQSLRPDGNVDVMVLHRRLLQMGVNAVLHRPACVPGATLSFIITALHTPRVIDDAVAATVSAINEMPATPEPKRAFG
jgi:8-amino-7-oxononanoate synthase